MPRESIEGKTEIPSLVQITDTDPVIVLPDPGAGSVLIPKAGTLSPFMRVQESFVSFAGAVTTPVPSLINNDDIAHTFKAFIVGTDIPGGRIEITPPGMTDAISVAAGALVPAIPPGLAVSLLLPGQHIEWEMQQAVSTVAPVVYGPLQLVDIEEALTSGFRFGSQIETFSDTVASVLQGPADPFQRRRVLMQPFESVATTPPMATIMNRDSSASITVPRSYAVVRKSPGNPDIGMTPEDNATLPVPSGNTAFASTFDLLSGESVEALQVEATVTDDPLAAWVYVDYIA